MFQRTIFIAFAGEIDELWPYHNLDHLDYGENIGRQLCIVLIWYFGFWWFGCNNGGSGALNKLSLKNLILSVCNATSD